MLTEEIGSSRRNRVGEEIGSGEEIGREIGS